MTATVKIREAAFSEDAWLSTVVIEAADGNRIFPYRFVASDEAFESDLLDSVKTRWSSVPDIAAWSVPNPHKTKKLKK